MKFLVESTRVAYGQAVAVPAPQRGRVRGTVGTSDAGLFDGG